MPVNIDPSKNPEKIPYMQFVPQIALPSVFNDALTYTEILGKVVATVNSTIDNVNQVASNMTQQVIEAITGARIPEYFKVLHNGNVMVDTDNWYLEDPEGLFNAIGAGKLCILEANASFNAEGYAVPNTNNFLKMILTQAWDVTDGNTIVRNVVFVNFDTYLAINVAKFTITKEDRAFSATTELFFEKVLVTTSNLNELKSVVRNKILVYKGDVVVPDTTGSYIELTDNGTTANLEEYFCVAGERAVFLASDNCPCIVVDYSNGNVGELRYGGAINPWVRIYSLGVKICQDVKNTVDGIATELTNLTGRVQTAENNITDINLDITGIQNGYTLLNDVTVQYVDQSKTESQKNTARNNIGAVKKNNAQVLNSISVINETNDATVIATPDAESNTVVVNLNDSERNRVIVRGVADPVNNYDAANKKFVVENSGIDAVKYVAQTPTDAEKYQARRNIGAIGPDEGEFNDRISIEMTGEDQITIYPEYAIGRSRLFFEGEQSNKVELMNVATPQDDYSAANKAYVDSVSGADSVKFVSQSLTTAQKGVARNNIDAVANQNGEISGKLTLVNTGINSVNLTPAQPSGQSGTVVLSDGNNDTVRISGVASPVGDTDAVNKYYVDNVGGNSVRYDVEQNLSSIQKGTARGNIDAVGSTSPDFFNAIHIEGDDNSAYISFDNVNELDRVYLVYEGGVLKVVKNYEPFPDESYTETLQRIRVAYPANNNDATTKVYVDDATIPIYLYCDGETNYWTIYWRNTEQRWPYEKLLEKLDGGSRIMVKYRVAEQGDTVTTTAVSWGTGVSGLEAIAYTEAGLNLIHLAADKTFTVEDITVT